MGKIHFDEIQLMLEPRKKVAEIIEENDYIEMTESESGFLCGLIRKHRPKTILEVGVAAGGTTAIIRQCLYDLNMKDAVLYSVDIDESYYRDPSKRTGYIADKQDLSEIKPRFFFGKIAYEFMEEIEGKIDLLILDTVHRLPGELLDIITLLPFMNVGGVIVLHDIAYNQYSDVASGYATGLVYSNLVGEKYLSRSVNSSNDSFVEERISNYHEICDYPNIGAMIVTDETFANIENLFLAMMTTWSYFPSDEIMGAYRTAVSKLYNEKLLWVFDQATNMNRNTIDRQKQKVSYRSKIIKRLKKLVKIH